MKVSVLNGKYTEKAEYVGITKVMFTFFCILSTNLNLFIDKQKNQHTLKFCSKTITH